MSNQAQTTEADQASKAIQTIEPPASEKGAIQDLEMVARSQQKVIQRLEELYMKQKQKYKRCKKALLELRE